MTALLPLALAALLCGVGGRLRRALVGTHGDSGDAADLALDLVVGLVLLHLLMLGTTFAGVGWGRLAWLIPASLLLLAWPGRSRTTPPTVRSHAPGPGDLVAGASVVVVALFAAGEWITTSDFVYHWGLKAKRFALFERVDWELLADPGNWRIHPDYPTLWPELLAASARLLGRFDEPILLPWCALLMAALLLAARQALRRGGVPRALAQAVLAALALLLAKFSLAQEMAGSADWLLALAVFVALPALAPCGSAESRENDVRVAFAAALAAGSKIEGLPLAGILLAVHLLASRAGGWNRARITWITLPALLVVVPWLAQAVRLHLFLATNSGSFDLARSGVIGPALLEVALLPAWSGAAFLLLLLPLGVALPRTRWLAVALLAQLIFYLWVYYTGPVDTRFYVLSSLPRLLLHLVPAACLGVALAIAGECGAPSTERAE